MAILHTFCMHSAGCRQDRYDFLLLDLHVFFCYCWSALPFFGSMFDFAWTIMDANGTSHNARQCSTALGLPLHCILYVSNMVNMYSFSFVQDFIHKCGFTCRGFNETYHTPFEHCTSPYRMIWSNNFRPLSSYIRLCFDFLCMKGIPPR